MLQRVVIFGPNAERFTITEWDWETRKVAVQPSNSNLEVLLQTALSNRTPLLYYPARDVYAVPQTGQTLTPQ
jgi:hypothetical protein